MQYRSLQHWNLFPSPVTSTAGRYFCFGSVSLFFLVLFLHFSPVPYWAPTDLGSSSFSVISSCLFILFMGFSRQEYWTGLPFNSPVDHVLSEVSTMTCLSWVVLHGMAHSFIELDKAVVHVISLIHFLWLWFFILSVLWVIRIRGLWKHNGRDWLWGKLVLFLMGGAMLSKFLIQFSVDGWGCVLSLLFISAAQSCLTLWSLQYARLPCPSPAPGAYSNSFPLSLWCHPTISSSVVVDLIPNYIGGNEDNGDLLQKAPCSHCCTQCPWPYSRPLPTHVSARDS